MRITGLILLSILFCFAEKARGQQPVVDISEVKLADEIAEHCYTVFFDKKASAGDVYKHLSFRPGVIFRGPIPNDYVTKKALVRIKICNGSDSSKPIYFFPGFYFPLVQLYRDSAGELKRIPSVFPPIEDNLSYRLITMAGHDTMTLVAELGLLKTYNNKLRPRLINPVFLPAFITTVRNTNRESDISSFIFSGLLLMMILYSMGSFSLIGRLEYLYYALYAFFIGVMLLVKAVYNYRTVGVNFFVEEYLDFILQCLGIIFYMLFMQLFLETRKRFAFLYQLYGKGIILLVVSILGYSFFHFATDNFPLENGIENLTKFLLLGMIAAFLVYSVRHWDNKMLRYLFWGNFFFLLFSVLSFLLILVPGRLGLTGFFSNSLLYYEIGLFFELAFFLTALNYKNRLEIVEETREKEMLRAQNILKEYEKEMAVYKAQQGERERISADMHDELGSGLTAIRLMSEIARNKMQEQSPAELEKISHSANDVLNKMNAIIWSMNNSNDTLGSLISYIRSYAIEFFDNTTVNCKVNAPDLKDNIEISGVKRRNIFLCVKETLHNIVKHAKASRVDIEIKAADALEITITDNGVGIDTEKLSSFGNGLKNMKRRMDVIGGVYEIRSANGTVTTLRLPL